MELLRERSSLRAKIACLVFTRSAAVSTPIEALAEACFRFSSQITLGRHPLYPAIFIEIGKSRRLFSEESIQLRLLALVKRFGWHHARPQIAIASHSTLAFVKALHRYECSANEVRYAGPRGFHELPLTALLDFAHPFQNDPEERKHLSRMLEKLQSLGLRNVGDFLKLPVSSLSSRFGKKALELRLRIEGKWEPAWPGFHPTRIVQERRDFDPGEATEMSAHLESLIFVIKGLLDRGMARLRARALRASTIRVVFELEKWSTLKIREREWTLNLTVPQGSVRALLPLLKEHIERDVSRHPLEAPVTAVIIEIPETAPGNGAQRDFFRAHQEEQAEAWEATVEKLVKKLGEERVFQAELKPTHLPEAGWKKIPPKDAAAQKELTFENWHLSGARPSRLLKKPEPVQWRNGGREQSALFHSPTGRIWRIAGMEGPERLSGEWWEVQPQLERDYYQVLTTQGERLWIYEEQGSLFLHGYFD